MKLCAGEEAILGSAGKVVMIGQAKGNANEPPPPQRHRSRVVRGQGPEPMRKRAVNLIAFTTKLASI
jgi:hypothetical protein